MSTQPKTEPLILTPTKCRLCGHIFPPETLHQATLLATSPTAKAQAVQNLMAPLMKHLEQSHSHPVHNLQSIDQSKNWTQFVELQVANYRGLLLLDAFETTEPVFLEQREIARAAIHRKTRKHTISDKRLMERLNELIEGPLDMSIETAVQRDAIIRHVGALLMELRDVLEERTVHPVNAIKAN